MSKSNFRFRIVKLLVLHTYLIEKIVNRIGMKLLTFCRLFLYPHWLYMT